MRKVIFIFGGGMVKDAVTGEWRSTSYTDAGDKFGLDGHRLRLEAAFLLWKDEPESVIVASGGKGQFKNAPGAPAVSSVMKAELVALGALPEKITEESESGNTADGVSALADFAEKEKPEAVVVVSNDYHLPRIKAMIEKVPRLKKILENGRLSLAGAETVLIEKNPIKWKVEIDRVYKSEAMNKRVQLEEKGIADFNSGFYKS